MSYEDARKEYLAKIREVERIDKLLDSSGEIPIDNTSSGEVDISASVHSNLSSGDTTYIIPPIRVWPDKIELPSGITRQEYQKIAQAFAQKNIMNDEIFTTLDPDRFDVRYHGFKGDGRVRRDFAFYLAELHDLVAPKLKKDKLYIYSSFRTIERNEQIYANKNQKATYSPHTGGIAVDVAATGEERYIIADQAWYMGFGGIAIGDDFVHLDISVKGYWGYGNNPVYISPDKKRVYDSKYTIYK